MSNNISDLRKPQLLSCESNKCKKYDIKHEDSNINDFLFKEDFNDTPKKQVVIPKKEKKQKKKGNIFLEYGILITLFVLLNSVRVITWLSSYKIGYAFSLVIRGLVFAVLVYLSRNYLI